MQPSPTALNPGQVQGWIDALKTNPDFLTVPGPNRTLTITDNPNDLSEGNQKNLKPRPGNVLITGKLKNDQILHRGLNQQNKLLWINPEAADGKPPLNIIIHEVGHTKWPGEGTEINHTDYFYQQLGKALRSYGIKPDPNMDLNGRTEEQIKDAKPRGDKKAEGLRYDSQPRVVSTTPSVNLTPLGGATVPVPYPVVGYFNESVKTTRSVNFTKEQAFTMASYVRTVHGDAPGSAGGVKSGTVSEKAEPIGHSESVRAEKSHVVRHDDLFYMNNRNTFGRAIFVV